MKSNKGLTLIELMIAMVVAGMVVTGIVGAYTRFTRTYTSQEAFVSAQEGLRGSLAIMAINLSMAGYNPTGGIDPSPGAPDFGIEEATATKIRFTTDYDMDGAVNNDQFERITYELDAGTRELREILYEGTAAEGAPSTLMGNVNMTDSQFAYFDADGAALGSAPADLSAIRSVLILLVVDEPAGQAKTVQRRLFRRVTCPNLYF
ncbi:MAG: PilW family protein [Thermodesulfobacteriota bacterium]